MCEQKTREGGPAARGAHSNTSLELAVSDGLKKGKLQPKGNPNCSQYQIRCRRKKVAWVGETNIVQAASHSQPTRKPLWNKNGGKAHVVPFTLIHARAPATAMRFRLSFQMFVKRMSKGSDM